MSPTGFPLGTRTYVTTKYGRRRTTALDPREFSHSLMAAQLATTWLAVANETQSVQASVRAGIRSFMGHLDRRPHTKTSQARLDVSKIRMRHLDSWELSLEAGSKQKAYGLPLSLFALLRRIEMDEPGTLDPEVHRRVQERPRAPLYEGSPVPAFNFSEAKRLRAAAHRVVYAATKRVGKMDPMEIPEPRLLTALHVLGSLATGEPPEVIRSVRLGNIAAPLAPSANVEFSELAHYEALFRVSVDRTPDYYVVTWNKNRAAGREYDERYDRGSASYEFIRNLIVLIHPLRAHSGSDAAWLTKQPGDIVADVNWADSKYGLKKWLAGIGLDIKPPYRFARFRKTVVAKEALRSPRAFLRREHRQSRETFFDHYTNSPELRKHGGGTLLRSVDDLFSKAVDRPLVLSGQENSSGLAQRGTDAEMLLRDFDAGNLDGPMTGCRSPRSSRFAREGQVCPMSATGQCFACSNAIISERHLPAVLLVQQITDPQRAGTGEAWSKRWRPIYESITRHVLPQFTAKQIDEAGTRLHGVALDLGIKNDVRGLDAE